MPIEAPFLTRLALDEERIDRRSFPFDTLGFLRRGFELAFSRPVTFIVGENGTGKSTLLQAIAHKAGLHETGGSRAHQLHDRDMEPDKCWHDALRASWKVKPERSYFFRADRFDRVARYIDVAGDLSRHGHREFRTRSHGEALFAFFETDMAASRGSRAIYILDEPEAALSPTRQMAFLRLIRDWEATKNIQVIVSTHSPIIMSYPGSSLFFLKCNEEIEEKRFIDTDHFKIYHRFIIDHEYMIKKIFAEK